MAKRAPKHLRLSTQAWWRQVTSDYMLEPHHVHLLTLAGEALDRAEEARETIAKEGLTVLDRFGQQKAHPLATVERDAMLTFSRLLRELDLDCEPAPAAARPPNLRRYN